MTFRQLAKEIRAKQSEYNQVVSQAHTNLVITKAQCKHPKVVIVSSAYNGSYSWDYDDAYDECRQCLICGDQETAEKNQFKRLLTPFMRLELGLPYGKNNRWSQTPLANCLATPLAELIKWVEQNGYTI